MKKNFLFPALFFCASIFVSCKKDEAVTKSKEDKAADLTAYNFKNSTSDNFVNNLNAAIANSATLTVGKDIVFPKAYSISREQLQALLDNPQLGKANIFLGLNDKKELQVMLIGADGAGKNLSSAESNSDNVVFSDVRTCPPMCK
ncbi:hypothetical protein NF867_01550 [Solitalea sp. MAHUQ-68]|uniref:Uncharacterized protein n=1 Tax=Solitalea agri TaxID=2953739 RepID=A0A9X2JAL1_9SPHI|nr:hypothetical protein [Solitalea agri]MCO4291547.1 hypothetical protein [Solitalea agri]